MDRIRRYRHEQTGRSLTGFLFCFALLGVVTLIGVRLVPVYVEHLRIRLSLEQLRHDGDLLNKNDDQIRTYLDKNWARNGVTAITVGQVRIDRTQNSLKLELAYDVIKPMAGNIDTVLHFRDGFEVNQ